MPYDGPRVILVPCPNAKMAVHRWDKEPIEPIAKLCRDDCEICDGKGYYEHREEPSMLTYKQYLAQEQRARQQAAESLKETFQNMAEPMERVKESFERFGTKVYDWQEKFIRAAMESDQIDALRYAQDRTVGRQDYPTDPDEVCCLCHEEMAVGYPPEAFQRRQAPYTYLDDLQGWAHDSCAKEYFRT